MSYNFYQFCLFEVTIKDYREDIDFFESNTIAPIPYANYEVDDSMADIPAYSDVDLYDTTKGAKKLKLDRQKNLNFKLLIFVNK